MERNILKKLLLVNYCIPFAFLGPYLDAFSGWHKALGLWSLPLFYLLPMTCVSILTGLCRKIGCPKRAHAGNALSLGSSLFFTWFLELSEKNWFFKPFEAYSMVVFCWVLSCLLQWVLVTLHGKINAEKEENNA